MFHSRSHLPPYLPFMVEVLILYVYGTLFVFAGKELHEISTSVATPN